MIENQDIEFKSVWKDEYLKWVCGMANANGGVIYIGKNDKGNTVGVNNAVKLVKEIPNKIKDTMGIIPEVSIEEDNKLLYIKITVDKYPTPISYQGKFYLRSGSNNHEVTGNELNRFLLERVGEKWESLPVKNATFDDLNEDAIRYFKKKALEKGRLTEIEANVDDDILLRNLGLYDGKYLNNAAILLFGKNPNLWIIGSYIKIGFFDNNDADLKYQDEIQGALILQIDKAIEIIYSKYLKALIHYEDIQRVEEYLIPREAFREILLNSVNHKLYEGNNPIQISIYDDKIYIWNDAIFPEELKNKNLYEKHFSKPYNPLIAQTFFKAGFIESWGRGFEKIKDECKKYNVPLPNIEINTAGVMIKCTPSETYMSVLNEMTGKKNDTVNDTQNDTVNDTQNFTQTEKNILKIISDNPKIIQKEIANVLNISEITVKRATNKLKSQNIIKRIGADKNGYWEIIK